MKTLALLIALALPLTAYGVTPSPPSNLTGGSLSQTDIRLNWKDNSNVEGGFQVFMSQDGTTYSSLGNLPPNTITFTAGNLAPNTQYWFKVRAFTGTNFSGYSNTIARRTNAGPSPTATPTATPGPTLTPTPTSTPSPSPSGGGIAERYPGDKNIGTDPEVILADDFESYNTVADMAAKWKLYGVPRMSISTTEHFAGAKSVGMELPVSTTELSESINKLLSPTLDTLYFRVYMKWDPGYNVNSSNHNGICMKGGPNPMTGVAPDGTDFFVALAQNNDVRGEGPPGWLHEYIYWPKQAQQWGDHWYPDGYGFSQNSDPNFHPLPNFLPQRDQWYCYEQMLKLNTVGKNDGEIKIWVDGKLAADWPDLIIRTVDTLKIDETYIGLHAIKSDRLNKKWYDNAVIAKSYIGPMSGAAPSPSPSATPTATPTATPIPPTPTPQPTATSSPTPSPTSTPSTPTPTPTVTATPSPSPSPTATPLPPTPTPTQTPTPTPPTPTATPTPSPSGTRTVTVEIVNPTKGHMYEIYYGEAPTVYLPVVATLTGAINAGIPNLTVGKTYYFANKVKDANGVYSAMSDPVSYTVTTATTQQLRIP